jgi:hypothetical protein
MAAGSPLTEIRTLPQKQDPSKFVLVVIDFLLVYASSSADG